MRQASGRAEREFHAALLAARHGHVRLAGVPHLAVRVLHLQAQRGGWLLGRLVAHPRDHPRLLRDIENRPRPRRTQRQFPGRRRVLGEAWDHP
jgi:hypothetical protein